MGKQNCTRVEVDESGGEGTCAEPAPLRLTPPPEPSPPPPAAPGPTSSHNHLRQGEGRTSSSSFSYQGSHPSRSIQQRPGPSHRQDQGSADVFCKGLNS